jgi:hypothetical protein
VLAFSAVGSGLNILHSVKRFPGYSLEDKISMMETPFTPLTITQREEIVNICKFFKKNSSKRGSLEIEKI